MKIEIEAPGTHRDASLEHFVQTTVSFATWHQELRADGVRVRLERIRAERGEEGWRCALITAARRRGTIITDVTGRDACEAVQEAADLLEVALLCPLSPEGPDAARVLAA